MIRYAAGISVTLVLAACVVACGSNEPAPSNRDATGGAGGAAAGTPGSPSAPEGAGEGGGSGQAPPPTDYRADPGSCGFVSAAFCDTFEAGPRQGGRSGELAPSAWSVARGMPYSSSSFDDAFRIGPAAIGACRPELSDTTVLPDHDVLVCDPTDSIPSRHALATAAAQNYGLSTYRLRKPFDFAGRTGTVKIDLDLTNNGLGGWPALILAEDPSPAPSFDWQERGSGPRNGFEVEFGIGWCNTPHTVEAAVYAFADYVQTAYVPSFDCAIPHATTAPGALNHVELSISESHLEVWASDASEDGVTFPNFQRLWSGDLKLPFSRGYLTIALRNHATLKYWLGSAATLRFDNVGFDGPKVENTREYSVPDSLTTYSGLPGCAPDGGACEWEGAVLARLADDAGRMSCAATSCTFDGQGRNVGYVVPNADEDTPAVALDFSDVDPGGAARAELVLAASYPWFEWNRVNHPPTTLALRYRVNGGPWYDRNITDAEANAFTDFSPELGGAGAGAGLLNQSIELDPAELVSGANRVELVALNTWTGTYRVSITGADLILTGS